MVRTTRIVAALGCCLVLGIGSSCYAGTLNLHGDAMPGFTGTAPFNNGSGLVGTLDYAVFTASDFNANFSGLGYVPGDNVVYTYQLESTGSANISANIVGITNPANTIGTFDIGDVNAFISTFVGTDAAWIFIPGVGTGQSSWGLAYSSPNLPMIGTALIVDTGTSANVSVPVPSDIPIPEPSSIALMGAGLMFLVTMRRLRAYAI